MYTYMAKQCKIIFCTMDVFQMFHLFRPFELYLFDLHVSLLQIPTVTPNHLIFSRLLPSYHKGKDNDIVLFVWGVLSTLNSYGDVTLIGKGLQNLDLSSSLIVLEQWGFLNVPRMQWNWTYVYMVIFEWHSHLLQNVRQWGLFSRLMSVAGVIWRITLLNQINQ